MMGFFAANIKLEGPVAVARWCAVTACVGNWNKNRARVSLNGVERKPPAQAGAEYHPIQGYTGGSVGTRMSRGPS